MLNNIQKCNIIICQFNKPILRKCEIDANVLVWSIVKIVLSNFVLVHSLFIYPNFMLPKTVQNDRKYGKLLNYYFVTIIVNCAQKVQCFYYSNLWIFHEINSRFFIQNFTYTLLSVLYKQYIKICTSKCLITFMLQIIKCQCNFNSEVYL